jgi:hypothetical protein
MRAIEPASMTEAERLAEIADLLARGAQRYFAAQIKAGATAKKSSDDLDVLPAAEPPCRSRVYCPQSTTA